MRNGKLLVKGVDGVLALHASELLSVCKPCFFNFLTAGRSLTGAHPAFKPSEKCPQVVIISRSG